MLVPISVKMRFRILFQVALILLLAGCGGTWDDEGNFKRIFDFAKPEDVKVIHSYYWKSPHWTVEYRYYIELEAPAKFANNLTAPELMTPTAVGAIGEGACLGSKPQWFLPKPAINYEAWTPKQVAGYRIFRDKNDGRLFVCDERL